MKAWLVVNGFLKSDKFSTIYKMLATACKRQNIKLYLKTNDEITAKLGFGFKNEDIDFVLFWDKDVRLCRYLEQSGFRVFNSSRAIEICDDKSLTALELKNYNIKMPKTIIAPKTFENIGYPNYNFINNAIEALGFPMIVKECFGSFGHEVYLVKNKTELLKKVKEIGTKPFIFQEFIKSSFGRDVRVHTVGNEIVAAVQRTGKAGSFISNVTGGGSMKPYILNESQKKLALDTTRALSIDFAGLDMLFGENGEPMLCEVNTNAHFKNLYDATGINVANYIIEYIRGKI